MHAIESIGPVLGIVAFVGLAILAFLLFQQARDIRRLREWAGRAPERANEAADAVQAAADASRDGEAAEGADAMGGRGRVRDAWDRVSFAARDRFAAVDRRLPVDGRYILAVLVVAIVAVGVVTSGFGLFGGGGGDGKAGGHKKQLPAVAVINGTSVPGLAATIEDKVVKKVGYESGPVGNAMASVNATVVEYTGGNRSEAEDLARAVKPKLGETPVQPMTADVSDVAGKADLALVLGLDDAGFGGGG
jgi:LytR cell envelope-related transcriptional attenuator